MPISRATAHHRGQIAGLKRAIRNGERPVDDPALVDAQRGLAAAKITDYIEKILSQAPPLSDEQRTSLAELLRPARQGGGEHVA
jgi:hypothetical protein